MAEIIDKEAPFMSQNENSTNRSLYVSEDVISDIIANAALEVEGVAAVAKGKMSCSCFKKKKNAKDIRIALAGDVLDVSLGIVLKTGAKAVATAENVQNKVKSSVQTMLNLTVTKVNVTVRDAASDN